MIGMTQNSTGGCMTKLQLKDDILKKCCIDAIKSSLEETANNNLINRETLRKRIVKKYPHIWKNKNSLRLKIILFKTKESGFFEKNGFIFDLKFKPIIDNFTIYDNGNGYCRIGRKYYHRVIMCAKNGEEVDHINGNKKDNRKSNLRICTKKQNSTNKKIKGFTISDNGSGNKYFKSTIGNKYFKSKDEAIKHSIELHKNKYGEFSPYSIIHRD